MIVVDISFLGDLRESFNQDRLSMVNVSQVRRAATHNPAPSD